MDPIFIQEQEHLTSAYNKLESIEKELSEQIAADLDQAKQDKENLLDDVTLDFAGDVNLETYVELEAMHQVIDSYNRTMDIRGRRLAEARLLLRQPYFAKVTLRFNPDVAPREGQAAQSRAIYIGAAGMTDEMRRHFIVDWRSPVAEVYYNQENGRTSYVADDRTIQVDLLCRRQFDITQDVLHSYFDTTVAIQDPLLLASLKRERTDRLRAITTTIQREQNAVIRHEDVPVLLVNGIAGSGKTSVLLQRIAFLLYRQRDTLRPDNVYLITPNDVFARYIADVLPDMGEHNPITMTWDSLMEQCGIAGRDAGADADAALLRTIDKRVASCVLESRDMADIYVDDERVVAGSRVFKAVKRYIGRFGCGRHLAGLVEEELRDFIEARIESRSASEDVQDALFDLDTEEQFRLFGRPLHRNAEEDMRDLVQRYLTDRYEPVLQAIERAEWLRVDRVGMRLLGRKSLSASEYLYCKLALTGGTLRGVRYVMVDEVQDYSEVQLMVMARLFGDAHFLLLGDENQCIYPHGSSFQTIRSVFAEARCSSGVIECGDACDLAGVAECKLTTSYRSTPEITQLFARLMPADAAVDVQSVQPSSAAPSLHAYDDHAAYDAALCASARDYASQEGLSAVIAPDGAAAKRIANMLRNELSAGSEAAGAGSDSVADLVAEPVVLDGTSSLPAQGLLVTYVACAKGLEFDRVIVADADESAYPVTDLGRHRLYTALSRATQQLAVLAQGALTPLLAEEGSQA